MLFLILSIIGFVLALCAHIATFFGINPLLLCPYVWLLHVGIFLGILPLLVISHKTDGTRFGRISIKAVFESVPKWLKGLFSMISIYAVMNFGLSAILLGGGSPELWDGAYVLQNKGEYIRALTEIEYHLYQSYEVRLFSGHWMLFYFFLSTAYYSYLNRKDDEC